MAMQRQAPVVAASAGAVGAAITAVLASLCCVGPAVVAVLGTGGALAIARLEPYRPYLLGAGVAMLAVAFWLAYRSKRACRDGSCAPRVTRFVRFVLWCSALVLAAAFLLPYFVA